MKGNVTMREMKRWSESGTIRQKWFNEADNGSMSIGSMRDIGSMWDGSMRDIGSMWGQTDRGIGSMKGLELKEMDR